MLAGQSGVTIHSGDSGVDTGHGSSKVRVPRLADDTILTDLTRIHMKQYRGCTEV